MNTTIREINELDIEKLGVLFNEYRIFYQQKSDINGANLFLYQRFINNESKIFVAEKESFLLGFVQLYPIFSSTRMKRLWLLNDLFVQNNHRNQGIAKLLMEKAQQFSTETQSVGFILETAKDNLPANTLYNSIGLELDQSHNYFTFNTK